MNESENLARIYAKQQTEYFGKEPFLITRDVLSIAISEAFKYGYHEGEVSILKTIHGIPEKDTNEDKRKNN